MSKTCTRCGGTYSDGFFRKDRSPARRQMHMPTRSVCIGCEQTSRDEEKQRDRWMVKARDAIRRHAASLLARGVLGAKEELALEYGWNAESLAHDFEHAYNNGCPYCRKAFKSMGHGLSDLTIDVIDRDKKPYYSTNTKIVCGTCNREKSTMSPEEWAARLIDWVKWEARQVYLAGKEWIGPLFDWIKGK